MLATKTILSLIAIIFLAALVLWFFLNYTPKSVDPVIFNVKRTLGCFFKDFCFDLYPNPVKEGSDVTVFIEVKKTSLSYKVYLAHENEEKTELNCTLSEGKCEIKLIEVSKEDTGTYWAFVDTYTDLGEGIYQPEDPYKEPRSGEIELEVTKKECIKIGEECGSSSDCCIENPHCWGSPFTCHTGCAQNGESAADDETCCSGYLNPTTKKCGVQPHVETCIDDGTCALAECSFDCSDCYGPDTICVDDGFCNKYIGENCENSIDCSCDGKACCSSSPDADEKGCSGTVYLGKGKECWCSNQCISGLKCNPTSKDFTDYENACCLPRLLWNGTECNPPEDFDWRNYKGENWLNPIRDQERCGSCWAFAALGGVEGVYNIEQNTPHTNEKLSEEHLVSDCYLGHDCEGITLSAFINELPDFIKNNGVVDEDCYPYASSNCLEVPEGSIFAECKNECEYFAEGNISMCSGSRCEDRCAGWETRLWTVKNWARVPSDRDEVKKALVCKGPLPTVSLHWRHAFVLVGYDDDSSICENEYRKSGCWIIRNQWGVTTGWRRGAYHEDGYGYIPYEDHDYSDLTDFTWYVEEVIKP